MLTPVRTSSWALGINGGYGRNGLSLVLLYHMPAMRVGGGNRAGMFDSHQGLDDPPFHISGPHHSSASTGRLLGTEINVEHSERRNTNVRSGGFLLAGFGCAELAERWFPASPNESLSGLFEVVICAYGSQNNEDEGKETEADKYPESGDSRSDPHGVGTKPYCSFSLRSGQ